METGGAECVCVFVYINYTHKKEGESQVCEENETL